MSSEVVTNPTPEFTCDLCGSANAKMIRLIAKSDNNRWLVLCENETKNFIPSLTVE